jgi:hypothetical protein
MTLFFNSAQVSEYNAGMRQRLPRDTFCVLLEAGMRGGSLAAARPAVERQRCLRQATVDIAGRLHADTGSAANIAGDEVAFCLKVGMPVLFSQRIQAAEEVGCCNPHCKHAVKLALADVLCIARLLLRCSTSNAPPAASGSALAVQWRCTPGSSASSCPLGPATQGCSSCAAIPTRCALRRLLGGSAC